MKIIRNLPVLPLTLLFTLVLCVYYDVFLQRKINLWQNF